MKTPNTLKRDLHVEKATWKDFLALAQYHYVQRRPPPQDNMYKIVHKDPSNTSYPNPIAIIIYSFPIPHLKARNIATDNIFLKPKTRSEQVKQLNKNVRYISRVIVDPRYRRLNLATWLIKQTLKYQTVPIIETLTPIDFTNHMFVKCGFQLYHNPAPARYRRFLDDLKEAGITGDLLRHPQLVQQRIDSLPDEQQEHFYFRLKRFLMAYQNVAKDFWQPEAIPFALASLFYPEAYLILRRKIKVTPTIK